MTSPRQARNPFWGLVVLSAAAFCICVLAYAAAGFGDRSHPLNQFFNRHGAAVTIGLALSTIVSGGLALRLDGLQTARTTPRVPKPEQQQNPADEQDAAE